MDKKQIGKYIMMFLGAVLTLGANLVNTKNQDDRMKETVAEKVKEALENGESNQAKKRLKAQSSSKGRIHQSRWKVPI